MGDSCDEDAAAMNNITANRDQREIPEYSATLARLPVNIGNESNERSSAAAQMTNRIGLKFEVFYDIVEQVRSTLA